MGACEDFVTRLSNQYAPLGALRDEHLKENFGELLPYVLFGAFVQWLEQSCDDNATSALVREILADLDWSFSIAPDEVQNLISVQLLENLPKPGTEGGQLRTQLGPALRAEALRFEQGQ